MARVNAELIALELENAIKRYVHAAIAVNILPTAAISNVMQAEYAAASTELHASIQTTVDALVIHTYDSVTEHNNAPHRHGR